MLVFSLLLSVLTIIVATNSIVALESSASLKVLLEKSVLLPLALLFLFCAECLHSHLPFLVCFTRLF